MARRREFEPVEALDKAMELFWRRGYQATSVQNLVDHLGINRQSLYDMFGDKHELFLATLDRYFDVSIYEHIKILNEPGVRRWARFVGSSKAWWNSSERMRPRRVIWW